MHAYELNQTRISIETYLEPGRRLRVLDLGWGHKREHVAAHRELFAAHDVDYRRVDVLNAPTKGGKPRRRYGIPAGAGSVDVVLCSQALEHVPFFWATALEIERVLAPGGFAFLCAPSRGHPTKDQDCWRFYLDAYRAMAAYTGMALLDAHLDLPRWDSERNQLNYAAVRDSRYWGDGVGVLRKPHQQGDRLRRAVVRRAAVWWANHVDDAQPGGVHAVPGAGMPLPPRTS
jgi:SAM-dependent methyltransferase